MRRMLLLLAAMAGPALAQTDRAAPGMVDAPVLARSIEKGERLAAADFVTKALPVATTRRSLAIADAAGKEAVRRLAAGSLVRDHDVTAQQVVKRGDTVVIAVRAGPLSITTAGRALTGGGVGEDIRVVSATTNRTLDAVVETTGHVRVTAL